MERRLAAIFAADVVGFSRMMAEDEVGTFERLTALRQDIITRLIEEKSGRVVKLVGDGLLAEFASVVDAVEAAIQIQEAVSNKNATTDPGEQIELRIGINLGDLIIDGDDIYGDGVNVAARLEPLARPGGICISRQVYENTRGKVSRPFEPAGVHRVKNIPEPLVVFRMADPNGQTDPIWSRLNVRFAVTAMAVIAILPSAAFVLREDLMDLFSGAKGEMIAAEDARPSIIVLPFENLGLPEAERYLADGLTDDLITDFSKVAGLMVIGSNTAFSYRDRTIDSRAVGRELGVRYVLEGSVRKVGARLLVNARLTDVNSGQTLWAERLERDEAEIFSIEVSLINEIIDQLGVDVSVFERERIERLPTTDLEAYDLFLRAEEAARSGFRPRLREALGLYSDATAIDPNFALAFASQARTEALVMRRNYDDVLPFPVARKRAYEHAGRALAIDPDAAMPFAVLSELQTVDRRYEEAMRSARLSVEKAPGEASAYLALSFAQTFYGRHEDAIENFEKALRLNPLLPGYARQIASLSYILAGHPQRAVEILEEIKDSSQGIEDYFNILAAAYAAADQMQKAQATAEEVARFAPHTSAQLYRVIFAHFQRQEELDRIIGAMLHAGVQEWTFGFQPGARERLSADEVAALIDGSVWQGNFEGRGPGLMQISDNGSVAMRTSTMFITGSAYVKDDTLCIQQPGLALGRPACGPIYKQAEEPSGAALPYSYVNAHILFHFGPGG
ncbi:adenylate/guanylate cyclase domain-containing protein [Ruegeria marina]|uniref:TolB amino-terminal domain-containing protein n=1 Tax=Ruegeria marina TaxID=639004 RepID=A0A1G7EYT5_9RHOB|nr:adenylate/guanylate cyclase domain-containing protein [Ruegeria marina]SDE68870.1 TolB amino-terminal domain-containing protein [Ruegeria marina]